MSITLATTLGNTLLDAIDDAVNAGAGAGTIQFATSDAFTTILATMTLNDPAFAAANSKSMALDVDPAVSATVAASGTVANFRFRDSSNNEVLRGTVGTSNADIIFDSVTWSAGGTVALTTGSLSIA